MKLTGENRSTRRKTCPSATLSTTNPTCTDPGANLGIRRGMLATNLLSHGTALHLFNIRRDAKLHIWIWRHFARCIVTYVCTLPTVPQLVSPPSFAGHPEVRIVHLTTVSCCSVSPGNSAKRSSTRRDRVLLNAMTLEDRRFAGSRVTTATQTTLVSCRLSPCVTCRVRLVIALVTEVTDVTVNRGQLDECWVCGHVLSSKSWPFKA
jgi:hypothetical protein